MEGKEKTRAQLTPGNTALNLVCSHSDRNMKEAAEQAANSICLFQVDGQCLTSSKFGMRELGCQQKRTRRFSQQKGRACFRLSGLKRGRNSPKQQSGWLKSLTGRMVLLDLLTALGRKENLIDSCELHF